jgi:hypothetical protein
MTNNQKIEKLKARLAALELELDRLKKLPPPNFRRIIMRAAAAAWRGELPPPAGRTRGPVCHSRLS